LLREGTVNFDGEDERIGRRDKGVSRDRIEGIASRDLGCESVTMIDDRFDRSIPAVD
jgi:hypothetical protein